MNKCRPSAERRKRCCSIVVDWDICFAFNLVMMMMMMVKKKKIVMTMTMVMKTASFFHCGWLSHLFLLEPQQEILHRMKKHLEGLFWKRILKVGDANTSRTGWAPPWSYALNTLSIDDIVLVCRLKDSWSLVMMMKKKNMMVMITRTMMMITMIMIMTMMMMTTARLMPACQASCWANYRGTRPLPHANDHWDHHHHHESHRDDQWSRYSAIDPPQ